jgi:hypothetical protein
VSQWLEARANLLSQELRLLPRRKVPAFVELVVEQMKCPYSESPLARHDGVLDVVTYEE